MILAKTFEGIKLKLPLPPPEKDLFLDCMFFTATCETLDNYNTNAEYKKMPTYILCNPNAMFY